MPESWLVICRSRVEGGMDFVRYKETLGGDRYICYLDCDDDLTVVVYIY